MPFTRTYNWQTDAANGVLITASRFDTEDDNFTSWANSLANSQPYYAADSGAADAYVATLTPAPSSYLTGLVVRMKASNTNTGASTLNVNALGAKAIQKSGSALSAGDIVANKFYELIYDGSAFQILSASTVGASTFTSLTVTGSTVLGDNSTADSLTVNASAAFNGNSVFNSAVAITGPILASGSARFASAVSFDGPVTLGDATADPVVVNGSADFKSEVNFGNRVTFGSAGTFNASANLLGNTTLGSGTANTLAQNAATVTLHADAKTGWRNALITQPVVTQYTTGTGTHNVTAGCKWIRVTMSGGGGGGGGGANATFFSGGGGGGAGGVVFAEASASAAYGYTVGGAGGGGATGGTGATGGSGSATTFGAFSTTGGAGGTGGTSAGTGGAGGRGGTASAGTKNVKGNDGGSGAPGVSGVVGGPGGTGGAGPFGGAGRGLVNSGGDTAEANSGAGGGGGSNGSGGTGASGFILIEEYFL